MGTYIFQFTWHGYISSIMGKDGVDISINTSEPIVVNAVPYYEKLADVLQRFDKR